MKSLYCIFKSFQFLLRIFTFLCFPFHLSFAIPQATTAQSDTILNVDRIDEMKFKSNNFSIVGNLYVPKNSDGKKIPVVIWVSGSGPSYRAIKSPESKKVVNCFLHAGFAYFRIDKPGYGDSKGRVNDDSLFAQLSTVVVDAVQMLKKLSFINSKQIGLFGSSQAGYIMPLAVSKSKDIAFMLGSSCPGENSIEQWNYLLEKQMLCEGYSAERARKSVEMFSTLRKTLDKRKFNEAIEYFQKHPMIVKSVNYDSTFSERAKTWWTSERNKSGESYFNPIKLIEKIKIPVFMVYGDRDTQIDPLQAINAYKLALKKAKNPFYKIKMLSGVDHNMSLTASGCLNEISELNKANNYKLNPAYIETLTEWLKILSERMN